jgi:hypothetical protein
VYVCVCMCVSLASGLTQRIHKEDLQGTEGAAIQLGAGLLATRHAIPFQINPQQVFIRPKLREPPVAVSFVDIVSKIGDKFFVSF